MTPTQRKAAERLMEQMGNDHRGYDPDFNEAAAILRELLAEPVINQQMTTELAEPVQEPVAWGVFVDDELFKPFNCKDQAVDWFQAQYNHGSRYDFLVLPLYTAPQQPMHCPKDGGECGAGGYCRPEPVQRRPLSDEQINRLDTEAIHGGPDSQYAFRFARAVEKAHSITGEQE